MKNFINIAKLIRSCERIEGRVKLQKIVHILQQAGYPFKEEFGYLHHGPYSSDLKYEIDQLVDWRLINEEPHQVIDYTQYIYAPSDKLSLELRSAGADSEPEWKNLAQELNRKSAQELEGISTIMFLRRRGFAEQKLKERFGQLKPHIAEIGRASCRERVYCEV